MSLRELLGEKVSAGTSAALLITATNTENKILSTRATHDGVKTLEGEQMRFKNAAVKTRRLPRGEVI